MTHTDRPLAGLTQPRVCIFDLPLLPTQTLIPYSPSLMTPYPVSTQTQPQTLLLHSPLGCFGTETALSLPLSQPYKVPDNLGTEHTLPLLFSCWLMCVSPVPLTERQIPVRQGKSLMLLNLPQAYTATGIWQTLYKHLMSCFQRGNLGPRWCSHLETAREQVGVIAHELPGDSFSFPPDRAEHATIHLQQPNRLILNQLKLLHATQSTPTLEEDIYIACTLNSYFQKLRYIHSDRSFLKERFTFTFFQLICTIAKLIQLHIFIWNETDLVLSFSSKLHEQVAGTGASRFPTASFQSHSSF